MLLPYRFAYSVGAILLGVFWMLIFLRRKDLRREMLVLSLGVAILGVSEHFYYGSYWTPEFLVKLPRVNVGVEDIILCFFYGGVASTIYEFVFKEKLKLIRRLKTSSFEWELLSLISGISVILFLDRYFQPNLIYSSTIGMFVVGLVETRFRSDLLRPALKNALVFVMIMLFVGLVFYFIFQGIVDSWWHLDRLIGIKILGFPIEEYLFHFSLGFCVGPMYEVMYGYRDCKVKSKRYKAKSKRRTEKAKNLTISRVNQI